MPALKYALISAVSSPQNRVFGPRPGEVPLFVSYGKLGIRLRAILISALAESNSLGKDRILGLFNRVDVETEGGPGIEYVPKPFALLSDIQKILVADLVNESIRASKGALLHSLDQHALEGVLGRMAGEVARMHELKAVPVLIGSSQEAVQLHKKQAESTEFLNARIAEATRPLHDALENQAQEIGRLHAEVMALKALLESHAAPSPVIPVIPHPKLPEPAPEVPVLESGDALPPPAPVSPILVVNGRLHGITLNPPSLIFRAKDTIGKRCIEIKGQNRFITHRQIAEILTIEFPHNVTKGGITSAYVSGILSTKVYPFHPELKAG